MLAALAAIAWSTAGFAQGIADLANPDDIMLRKPVKQVQPAQPKVDAAAQQQLAAAKQRAAEQEAAAKRAAAEKAAAEQAAAKAAADKAAAEQAAAKAAADKAAAEQAAAKAAAKAAMDKAAAEKALTAKQAAEAKAAAEKAAAEKKAQEDAAELAKLRAQVAASEKARQEAMKAQQQAEQKSQSEQAAREQAEQKIKSEQAARAEAEAKIAAEREAAKAAKAQAAAAEAAALAAKKKKLEAPVRTGDVAAAKKPGAAIRVKKTLTGRPAVITAERTDYDRKEGVILFDRNVYVDDEQYQMHADRLFVFLDGTNDLKRIVALGNVSITNEAKTAACAKAVYSRADQRIIMFGENEQNLAWLRDAGSKKGDSSEVSGMRITYWFDSEVATVEGVKVKLPGIKGGSPKDLFGGGGLGGKGDKDKGK